MARIVFMGTPEYAKIILQKHIETDDVVLVITQPDRPVGRKRVMTAPPLKELAVQKNIDCIQPQKLDNSYIETIQAYKPDFLIVAAYGQLLSQEILDIATPINLHASLLPLYRGASPVQECLLKGDIYTGVTAMLMQKGLDSGPILGYRAFKLGDENLQQLMEKLSREAAQLSVQTVQKFQKIAPLAQNGALKSYCKKVKSGDGQVSFEDARKLTLKFRAYFGWPGIFLQSGLKIKAVTLEENSSKNTPGEIITITKEGAVVGCKRGTLFISSVQPKNKKSMDIVSYLNGKRLGVGDILF